MLTATPNPPPALPGRPLVADTPHFASDLTAVIDQFSSYGRRLASRHGLDAHEVDEVLQDLRIRLWRAAAAPGGVRHANARYIHKTVVSASLDLLRRRQRRNARALNIDSIDPLALAVDARADALLEVDSLSAAVGEALIQLPRARREAVRLGLLGHDRFEIARLTGWSETRTRNLLYRGLADLRTLLKARGITPDRASSAAREASPSGTTTVHSGVIHPLDRPARPTRAA